MLEQIAFAENNPVEMTIFEAKGPNVNSTKIPQLDMMLSSTLEKSIDTRQNSLGLSTTWVWQNLDYQELRMHRSNMISSSSSIRKLRMNWVKLTMRGTIFKKVWILLGHNNKDSSSKLGHSKMSWLFRGRPTKNWEIGKKQK